MRSCIYCGRELEKGEKCNCAQAVARRKSSASENTQTHTDTGWSNQNYTGQTQQNSYHTGYTKKVNPIKKAWEKHKIRKRSKHHGGVWDDVWKSIKNTVKSPVDSVVNPRMISNAAILILAMLEGAVIWLCIYLLRAGIVRSPFGMVLSMITLNPTRLNSLRWMLMSIVSGALGGILLFFIYTGVFHFINRLIFRQRSGFWNLAQRTVLTPIPFAIICAIGCVFGLISSTTLAIMIICGIIAMVALTYEALKAEWISRSSGKIMYAMMLGFFIVVFIICYVIRLS